MKLKRMITLAVVGIAGIYVVNETRAGSHFSAWFNKMSAKIESKITPEAELARIKLEVGKLDDDVDRVKGDLAEANVNVRLIRREIEEMRGDVKESETALRKHAEVIKAASESDKIQWGFRTVGHNEAKELLMSEVQRHNDLKARFKSHEVALATQEQTREIIEQQLQEMLKQKDELYAAVGAMEADIKLAKVEQIRSKYQNDGSRMADVKSSLAELRKKILVQREKLKIHHNFDRSPAEGKSVDEILAGLDGNAPKKPAADEVKVIVRP